MESALSPGDEVLVPKPKTPKKTPVEADASGGEAATKKNTGEEKGRVGVRGEEAKTQEGFEGSLGLGLGRRFRTVAERIVAFATATRLAFARPARPNPKQ